MRLAGLARHGINGIKKERERDWHSKRRARARRPCRLSVLLRCNSYLLIHLLKYTKFLKQACLMLPDPTGEITQLRTNLSGKPCRHSLPLSEGISLQRLLYKVTHMFMEKFLLKVSVMFCLGGVSLL